MVWYEQLQEGGMFWDVKNEDCLAALEELHNAPSYEKVIVAEGAGHHVVFFEGEEDGSKVLMEASITPEWDDVNSGPSKTMAGRVENVYEFRSDWGDIYLTDEEAVVNLFTDG